MIQEKYLDFKNIDADESEILLRKKTMIFLIVLVINIIFGYIIFGDQFSKKPIFNYSTSIEKFGITAFSVIFYFLISTICLLFLLLRIDIYLIELIEFPHKEEIVNSGLSFAIFLMPMGYLIRALYYVIYFGVNKLGEKHNKKYMNEITKNEQTVILIISCFSLITIVIASEKDYELAFFIMALILGKFFWVDSSIVDFLHNIRDLIKLKVFVAIILYWTLSIFISAIFGESIVLKNIISIVVGFVMGMLIYININRKKING